jgi:EAL domain-containing protein (putative c-di-GMP-specific phosphodiesterase class I)
VADETGLIVPLGEWVLRAACAQARRWQRAGLPPIGISVNVEARQLRLPDFVAVVKRVLEESDLEPRWLKLELTESGVMEDPERSLAALRELCAAGVQIAIDDFGTGYSSLNQLKRLPIATLKLDRSFVRDVVASPSDAAMTAAIIAMGQSLRLEVVAEGVETVEQLAFLQARGCDAIQGYLFSRPVEPAAFEQLLRLGPLPVPALPLGEPALEL